MKLKRIATILLSLLISVFIIAVSVITVIAYSSDEDPLITLSYLTEIIMPNFKDEVTAEYTKLVTESIATFSKQLDSGNTETDSSYDENRGDISGDDGDSNGENVITSDNSYTLIELSVGQKLFANSATEIIVRPGSIVSAISPFENQGIADITNGIEILNEHEVPINAYCIIPRGNDGRGLYVHSDKAFIMIRGEYTVE